MSDLFGDFKRPKAELKIINEFVQSFNQSRKEYKSKNYQKALSGFKAEYEILKDIYDVYPKIVLLYLIIKCKFKLNDYNNCESYISKLENNLMDIFQFQKNSFIKYKAKLFLFKFLLYFTLDKLESSIKIVIEMITHLKESNFYSLEEKIYFFWVYIKGFIKISKKHETKKFLYFKEQYDSMLIEEIDEKKKLREGIEFKQKKISRGFMEEYKSFMNSKMKQIIYENLDQKFYYLKYGKVNIKFIQFLNRNMDIYIKTGKKDKLIEKFKGFLMVSRIDLKEYFNKSMEQIIQEQRRRILAFNTIFCNLVGAFNHIFLRHFTDKEVAYKQMSRSRSTEIIYDNKDIKEMEEKLIKYTRKVKPIDLNSKKDENKIKLESLNYKQITFPYNFKKEIGVPPNINDYDKEIKVKINEGIHKKFQLIPSSVSHRGKLKLMRHDNSNLGSCVNLPLVRNKNKNFIKLKNEENKNSTFKGKKLRKNLSASIIKSNRINASEIINIYKYKNKKENKNNEVTYRNINYYLISKLIEIYENTLKIKELNNIKTEKNYNEKYNDIFPRKNDLYNFNKLNNIKEYNTFSIKGTNSKNENQDNYFFYEDFLLIKNFYLFGVCDGHGKLGEFISKAVSFLFPAFINYILIEDNLNKKKQDINDMILNLFKLEESPKVVKEIFILRYITDKFKINYNYYPFLSGNMQLLSKLLYESCYYIQKELIQRYHYEIDYSGTTLCSGFLLGKTLYISNVGDSRAILCKYDNNFNKWSYKQLSLDHIPSAPGENKRIMANNGKIQRIKNELGEEIGPLRIFEKDNDSMLPGISMSRSIGDLAAEKLGVTFEPELFKYDLEIGDKIIIIGSDGFWAYLSNEEVIDIVSNYYDDGMRAEEISVKMVEIAKDKWIEENKKNPSWYNYHHNNNLGIRNANGKKNKRESLSDFNFSINYEQQKEKKYYYDDITCMIIFLDIK